MLPQVSSLALALGLPLVFSLPLALLLDLLALCPLSPPLGRGRGKAGGELECGLGALSLPYLYLCLLT